MRPTGGYAVSGAQAVQPAPAAHATDLPQRGLASVPAAQCQTESRPLEFDMRTIGGAYEMTPRERELLSLSMQELALSPTGRGLLEIADAAGAKMAVVRERDMESPAGRAAGLYLSSSRTVLVASDVAANPRNGAVVLAHELQHLADDRNGHLRSGSLRLEANAFVAEAHVARDLGVRTSHYGMRTDGSVRTPDEAFALLADSAFYARAYGPDSWCQGSAVPAPDTIRAARAFAGPTAGAGSHVATAFAGSADATVRRWAARNPTRWEP